MSDSKNKKMLLKALLLFIALIGCGEVDPTDKRSGSSIRDLDSLEKLSDFEKDDAEKLLSIMSAEESFAPESSEIAKLTLGHHVLVKLVNAPYIQNISLGLVVAESLTFISAHHFEQRKESIGKIKNVYLILKPQDAERLVYTKFYEMKIGAIVKVNSASMSGANLGSVVDRSALILSPAATTAFAYSGPQDKSARIRQALVPATLSLKPLTRPNCSLIMSMVGVCDGEMDAPKLPPPFPASCLLGNSQGICAPPPDCPPNAFCLASEDVAPAHGSPCGPTAAYLPSSSSQFLSEYSVDAYMGGGFTYAPNETVRKCVEEKRETNPETCSQSASSPLLDAAFCYNQDLGKGEVDKEEDPSNWVEDEDQNGDSDFSQDPTQKKDDWKASEDIYHNPDGSPWEFDQGAEDNTGSGAPVLSDTPTPMTPTDRLPKKSVSVCSDTAFRAGASIQNGICQWPSELCFRRTWCSRGGNEWIVEGIVFNLMCGGGRTTDPSVVTDFMNAAEEMAKNASGFLSFYGIGAGGGTNTGTCYGYDFYHPINSETRVTSCPGSLLEGGLCYIPGIINAR